VRLQLAALLDGQAGAAAVAGEILADDSLQEGVRRQLEPVYAASLFYSGRVFEAYEVARRIRPAFPLSNHTEELALIAFSMISFESGQDLRGLEREMAEIFEEGVRIGDDAAAGVAAAALSGIAFLAGRYRDAKRWLGEAELHRERHDTFGALLITWATRVGVAHFSGDDDGAAVALARCEDALQGRDPLPNQLRYIVCARAWAADADGDRAAAQRLLLDGADSVAARPLYAALLRYEAMRCGTPPDEVAASLVRLGERCDARLVMAYAGHAVALASHDGAGLLEAANEFERIGALRYATEAAAHATQAFLAAGEEESARRAFARSSELFADGQDGIMPVIEGLDRAAVGLTAREGQLVELARQGLTNVAIAERLVLSVRTVESHLYRAMHKLGVSDRRQL
jgi:DNA-binding CsgD family transcriptional regulator